MSKSTESLRLNEIREAGVPWRKWGPYLSERQWGTVREDYSESGDAWGYFTHDQARSRAYLWGEDGLAGISDDRQNLCFALALWNGVDPIVKERLFGLTNSEGNHGEDVKEYYYYLDSTPTHSYMKYLYKYPQSAFPYDDLVRTNAARGRQEQEYELIDTGVFDEDRYFDVFVEYAKASPEDVLVRVTAWNRGPEAATLHILPTLWFRNTWWPLPEDEPRPRIRALRAGLPPTLEAEHPEFGMYRLMCEGSPEILVTNNETNNVRVFGTPNETPYVKDGINDHLVAGVAHAVDPEGEGTKASAHYGVTIAPGESAVVRVRLTASTATVGAGPTGTATAPTKTPAKARAASAKAPAGATAKAATRSPSMPGSVGISRRSSLQGRRKPTSSMPVSRRPVLARTKLS